MKKLAYVALVVISIIFISALALLLFIPEKANRVYGPANPALSTAGKFKYAALVLWQDGRLTRPLSTSGPEQQFKIESGETVGGIANRLEEAGLIYSAAAFKDYLVYRGLDTTI